MVTISLSMPISAVTCTDNYPGDIKSELSNEAELVPAGKAGSSVPAQQEQETSREVFSLCIEALQGAADKLNEFYNKVFSSQKQEIVKLSVEIAGKILARKIESQEYDISAIVEKTLETTSTHEDVVIHLHPEDFENYRKMQNEAEASELAGIKLVSDSNVGRAECIVVTPKGRIQSIISENLERIEKALNQTE
ncbi:MAG: FliH/SctL family protein [Planctomycetota bacterium]